MTLICHPTAFSKLLSVERTLPRRWWNTKRNLCWRRCAEWLCKWQCVELYIQVLFQDRRKRPKSLHLTPHDRAGKCFLRRPTERRYSFRRQGRALWWTFAWDKGLRNFDLCPDRRAYGRCLFRELRIPSCLRKTLSLTVPPSRLNCWNSKNLNLDYARNPAYCVIWSWENGFLSWACPFSRHFIVKE